MWIIYCILDKISLTTAKVGGIVSLYQNQKLISKNIRGNIKNIPIYKYADCFINILLIQTLERYNLNINDKTGNFISELYNSKDISFLNVLRDDSGLCDVNGILASKLEKEEFYLKLSDHQKEEYNLNMYYQLVSFEKTIEIYNHYGLEHTPGVSVNHNGVTRHLGIRLIEVINNKPYLTLLDDYLNHLKIKPQEVDQTFNKYLTSPENKKITYEINNEQSLFFSLEIEDIYQIYNSLVNGTLINKNNLKIMKKIIDFQGISFTESFGSCYKFNFAGVQIISLKRLIVLLLLDKYLVVISKKEWVI